jgi:chromosome segregation ATPase
MPSNAGCRSYTAALRREAIAAVIALVLNLIVLSQLALPNALATALVAKQRKIPHVHRDCSHVATSPSNSSVSLFQQESTPFTGQHLQDWRTRLRSQLESQNTYQLDSVVRSVAQICQDLESRCNTVEEPLRREKIRSKELEQRVEELSEQISSLEAQAADDRFHLDGLEDEKLGLSEERDQVSVKLDELRMRFEGANRDAGEVLRVAREGFDAKELELRSTILNREEQLRDRDIENQELRDTVHQVKGSLEHTKEELRALGERCEDLQVRLDNAGRQLDDERDAKFRQSEEILKLRERGITLEHQLQTTEADLEAISGQLSDLGVSHEELKQSSENALREAKAKYAISLDAAALKAEEQCKQLDTKLAESLQVNRQLKEVCNKTWQELQTLKDTFSALRTRTQELNALSKEQEAELKELRTLRRNVLASMGLGSGSNLAIRSASRSASRSPPRADPVAVPETPREPVRETREPRRRKSAIHTQDLAQKVDAANQGYNTEVENVAEEFIAQNGSTPKRQKPRPSYKMPTMQTPFNQKPTFASRSTSRKMSPVKRSALRQMSPNRRHTTVGFALSETEDQGHMQLSGSTRKRQGSQCEESQDDFDMDDSLAGTPFTPGAFASGTGRLPEEDDTITTEL